MNKREESKVETYKNITGVIETPDEGVTLTPAMITAKDELKIYVTRITEKEGKLKSSTVGKTEAKDSSLVKLIKHTVVVAGSIYAYAVKNEIVELQLFADLSENMLRKNRQTDIPVRAKNILLKALELGTKLSEYGTTIVETDELAEDLTEFETKDESQNEGVNTRTEARKDLDFLFSQADKRVKVIQRLMSKFQDSYPEYFNRFEAARNIRNKSSKKKTEEAAPTPQS